MDIYYFLSYLVIMVQPIVPIDASVPASKDMQNGHSTVPARCGGGAGKIRANSRDGPP